MTPTVIPSELSVAPDPTVILFVDPLITTLELPIVAIPVIVIFPALSHTGAPALRL